MNRLKIKEELKCQAMFGHLGEEDIELLLDHSELVLLEPKDFVCRKGREARQVFMVLSGTVSEYAIDGNEFTIMIKEGGKHDCFGELAVLLEKPYITSVVALGKVKVLAINAHLFSRILWQNKSAIQEVLALCIKRLQLSAQKSISYTHFNAEGRLAYILLMMQNEKRDMEYIKATQEGLSERCGIARQTASVILNEWKRDGILSIGRGKIRIHDEEALTEIALYSAKNY
ncbi:MULTISPECIES: Crp/Fnr family transcriptional regulator [unclassified Fusibacter]|uniref:Crp/Fnr family transcriptional regulator n=1 Tax=unclassified Fusibacter TaxID=2624464 RepID=UPI0010107900|nr:MULTISPECIES: Crp/Fnr family transcriptional regulator [unclassified Fusibacter]MCK8060627.1 Crp/Fnr family transcriptional regulator [Fusibacter sp. A2]NPE22919.1 Crp/Fnr family transcriptional regulator [Fusibacter sp. A1]RXV59986.1 Crp/Fnr family transcriptional regulator [Fusibacter sp. A1]